MLAAILILLAVCGQLHHAMETNQTLHSIVAAKVAQNW
jgi:hypothetical protein